MLGTLALTRLASAFNSMAAALQRQIRQLEDLSRVQRRFVSDVSHELRTPLTTVRMAADVLHEGRQTYTPAAARSSPGGLTVRKRMRSWRSATGSSMA